MSRYSWLVVFFAALGFVTSLTIHIAAYLKFFPAEIFLLYCRIEWIGVAFLAWLLGVLMPTAAPRRQLLTLLRWMAAACIVLVCYVVVGGGLYVTGAHPRKIQGEYVVVRGGQTLRHISDPEYYRLAERERYFYLMYINRAFSLVWVILFFGIGVYGIGYLRMQRRLGLRTLSSEKYVPWWYGGA